jgi:hypothetical protein
MDHVSSVCLYGLTYGDPLVAFTLFNFEVMRLHPVLIVGCTPIRRHAERTVQLWLQRLKDSSSSKRLVLIYLANGNHLSTETGDYKQSC